MRGAVFKLQPVELALLGTIALLVLLLLNSGHAAFGTLSALLFATWIVSRAAPHVLLRRLRVRREELDTAVQDDSATFSFCLLGSETDAARFFTIEDRNPAAFPGERAPAFYVAKLAKGEDTRLSYRRSLYKRGVYTIGPAVARCGFPFGIVEVVRELPDSTHQLRVLPRVYALRRLPLAGLNLGQPHSFLVARGGGDQSFLGVREYRRGDSPRHIHWPSTARQGELIVKEFESERSGQVSILLDLNRAAHVGVNREATFEYLAAIAASVAAFALEHRQVVQILGWTGDAYQRGPVSGQHALGLLLNALAEIEPASTVPFVEAIGRIGTRLSPGGSVVCVFSDLNPPEICNALVALERRNLEVCAVIVRANSFDPGARSATYALPATIPAVYVARGGDLAVHFGGP